MIFVHAILLLILLSGFGMWVSFVRIERVNQSKLSTFNRSGIEEAHYTMAGFKVPLTAQLEKKYLIDTGIQWIYPKASLSVLIVGCLINGIIGGWLGAYATGVVGMMIPGIMLFGLLPIKGIFFWKAYQEQQMRTVLPLIFGILGKWASVQADLYFCLGKLIQANPHDMVTKTLLRFQSDIASGCPVDLAFERLGSAVGSGLLKEFYVCLSQIERNRGDLIKLIEGFEQEAFHVEMEVSKRRAENLKQVMLIALLNAAGFGFLFLLLSTNRILSEFYVGTTGGNFMITIVAIIFVLIFNESTKFYEHSL